MIDRMGHGYKWIVLAAFGAIVLPSLALAFPRYNDGCQNCHGAFTDATSPRGTVFLSDSKHEMHRSASEMNTECNLCHTSGDQKNPYIGSSNGTSDNMGVGCTGCHGRNYGGALGNSGVGLREHHAVNGVNECASCHSGDPVPLGENVFPLYYGTVDTLADDPCNSSGLEDWTVGDGLGLDNDGDNDYDTADADCAGGCGSDAECDDGVFCNGAEVCIGGSCFTGTPVDCNDGVGCTADSCNEGTDSCDNVPDDAVCDNGLFCDGSETCDTVNDCLAGPLVDCDDGVGCTVDSCNEGTDSCDNVPDDAVCDNGLFCDGVETCDALNDCQAGVDPCSGGACDEASDTCPGCVVDADCNDGAFCNGSETCVGGTCVGGTPVDCNDGVGCTADSCNEVTDSCDNVPDDAVCDNGLFCDGAETCDTVNDCLAGTPVGCNDGVGCTADSCNEVSDSCDNVPDDAACDNGLFCDGIETCDAVNDCQAGTDPCPGAGCDEVADVCTACNSDGVCDSGEDCNSCPNDCISGGGAGFCGDGVCAPALGEGCLTCATDCNGKQNGKPANQFCCGDGQGTNPVGCSDARCSADAFVCSDVPIDPYCCGDGFCDGAETSCSCEIDCGAPPVSEAICDDGVDNDCDGLIDSGDPDCPPPPCSSYGSKAVCTEDPNCVWEGNPKSGMCADAFCTPTASDEVGLCDDGIDNDCDGVTDCADTADCGGDPICQQADCSQFGDKRSCNAQATCRWDNKNKMCINN